MAGRFDLFDAWIALTPGSCSDRKTDQRRAQIARGQEIFNAAVNANGRTCNDCHNVANNGTHINGAVFDIGTSAGSRRTADLRYEQSLGFDFTPAQEADLTAFLRAL